MVVNEWENYTGGDCMNKAAEIASTMTMLAASAAISLGTPEQAILNSASDLATSVQNTQSSASAAPPSSSSSSSGKGKED